MGKIRRYNMEDIGTPEHPESVMVENEEGEWVKHEDIREILVEAEEIIKYFL